MDSKFASAVEALHPAFERLRNMKPTKAKEFPAKNRVAGVYLFSEGSKNLYVGRSNNIRGRYGRHCNPGATHRMAAFAFKLAREATGKMKASYKSDEESRAGLMKDPKFRAAFDAAKARIRAMDFRYVEEANPTRQALLEIYCSVALGTPYNDFDTH